MFIILRPNEYFIECYSGRSVIGYIYEHSAIDIYSICNLNGYIPFIFFCFNHISHI